MTDEQEGKKETEESSVLKVLLFEDIDIVFNDEFEFYGQLVKLL
jgi:hypothetical protein